MKMRASCIVLDVDITKIANGFSTDVYRKKYRLDSNFS